MGRRRLALALLACVLLAAGGLRVAGGADKSGFTHDESISYLAAACHQGDYARITVYAEPPFGRWVAASDWKALLRPDRALCLGDISRDLAREDIHPPLYFWLLHGWTLAFGVGLWTGLSLNIVLATLTGLAVFGLARRVLGDPLAAVAVAGVWSFSPAAIRVFGEARQYELLALLAVVFVWQCVRFADPPTRTPRRDAAGLAALAAAGALAHFLFALVAVAGAGLLAVRLRRRERRLVAPGLASIAAGYAVFSLVHPQFLLSVRRGRAQAAESTADLVGGRAEATVETLAEFLVPPVVATGAVGAVALGVLAGATAWAIVVALRSGGTRPAAASMPVVFVWLAAAHTALFLSFVSPPSGMDFKHLSALWPFAAFVPVLVVGSLPGRVRVPLGAVGAAALTTAATIAALGQFPAAGQTPPRQLERTERLVLDNVARGVLPRIVWPLPDDARVFAADQRHLLGHPGAWLNELGPGTLYVGGLPPSDPRYGNSPALGRRVAGAISGRHRLIRVPGRELGAGRVYRLGPAEAVAGAPRRRGSHGDAARVRAFLERPEPRRAAR